MAASRRPVRTVLYWDIDGTLLSTGRAGVPALEDGAEAVVGRRPDLSSMRTAGMTDRMIARAILADLGQPVDEDMEEALLRAYAAALPGRLTLKRGSVLPGVVDALDALAARGDVANVLLTGNVRAGADAKLRSYGLDHHFELGAFAEDGFERPDIARAALARAEGRYGAAAAAGVLIGDTPFDVLAGAAVGVRVVAVGATPESWAALHVHAPWWLVDQVPAADVLLERIDRHPLAS